NPVAVLNVAQNGPAAEAEIHLGDIVRAVDGVAVSHSSQLNALLGRHLAGDRINIQLLRGGEEISKSVVLKPKPLESSPDADVLYRISPEWPLILGWSITVR